MSASVRSGAGALAAEVTNGRAHGGALARGIRRDLDGIVHLAQQRAYDSGREHHHAHVRDLTDLQHLVRALDHELDRAYHHARTLAHNPPRDLVLARGAGHAVDLSRELELPHTLADGLRRAHLLAWDLSTCLARVGGELEDDFGGVCQSLVDRLQASQENARTFATEIRASGAASVGTAPVRRPPAGPALRVTRGALRILRPRDRARYREEWLAELQDLTDEGAGRRAQLVHALRLLTHAWAQRRALAAPHPGRERAR